MSNPKTTAPKGPQAPSAGSIFVGILAMLLVAVTWFLYQGTGVNVTAASLGAIGAIFIFTFFPRWRRVAYFVYLAAVGAPFLIWLINV